MVTTFNTGLLFLVNTLFDLYLFILAVRLILAFVGANYFDPITQFVIKLTDFWVKPLKKIIPNAGGIEFSTLIIILLIQVIKFTCISLLSIGMPNYLGIIILALGDTIKLFINTFFYAILIQVILSWIQPMSPANRLLYQLTSPIMTPMRRIVPPISGIDISPIPALILLQLLIILVVNPIMSVGIGIALG